MSHTFIVFCLEKIVQVYLFMDDTIYDTVSTKSIYMNVA